MPKGRKKGSKNKTKKEIIPLVETNVEVEPVEPNVEVEPVEPNVEVEPVETNVELIKITLKSFGRVYHSEGETFEEAIGKIKISGGAKYLSIITVEKNDGKTITKILNPRQTNGIFGQGSPSLRAIHLKGVRDRLGL